MKLKATIGCVLVAMMLATVTPVLALGIGISPSSIELEVPGGGSATTNLQVHYFSGDVEVSLIDIPLRVEPSIINVDALSEPVPVELTIYGNHSLDTQVYDGYIRFIAVSGGAATGGVEVRAKITNIADGIAPVEEAEEPAVEEPVVKEPIAEEPVVEEPAAEEPVVEQQDESPLDTTQPGTAAPAQTTPPQTDQSFPWVIVIGAGVGGALVTILAVSLWRRLVWRD